MVLFQSVQILNFVKNAILSFIKHWSDKLVTSRIACRIFESARYKYQLEWNCHMQQISIQPSIFLGVVCMCLSVSLFLCVYLKYDFTELLTVGSCLPVVFLLFYLRDETIWNEVDTPVWWNVCCMQSQNKQNKNRKLKSRKYQKSETVSFRSHHESIVTNWITARVTR